MALLDVLRERAAQKGRTAQIECGLLGVLTVEALPVAECARYKDDRALLYAACRELQTAGEVLRREKKLFRPDEVLQHLTDEEAAVAAGAIRTLSIGLDPEETFPSESEKKATAPHDESFDSPLPASNLPEPETLPAAVEEPASSLQESASSSPAIPRLSSAEETAQVAPILSPEELTSGFDVPSILPAAISAPDSAPFLHTALTPSPEDPQFFSREESQHIQPPRSPQTQNALAEKAAEILARELCRAAQVR